VEARKVTTTANPTCASLSAEQLKWILSTAILTRSFETRSIRLAKEGFLPPLLHPGAGQEVSQLAALVALNDDDPLLYGHRGIAYLVGRGVPLDAMLADMAGREGGTNNGKGGIMHVVDPDRGVYGQSGTLGGGFVIATGIAMALKKKRVPKVVAHFFGDGTANRGTFHESLNWCALQKLPVVFICENNGWAVSVPASESTCVEDISVRALGYGIPGVSVDGGDPDAVYKAVVEAAMHARSDQGPSLIEIKNIRLLGHYATDPQDYREDRDAHQDKDPVLILRQRLLDEAISNTAEIEEIEANALALIEEVVRTVKDARPIGDQAAFADLYV
jgi:pyruvate dehydrogenase E1 component alpha subunit